jgi:hypothetical protein
VSADQSLQIELNCSSLDGPPRATGGASLVGGVEQWGLRERLVRSQSSQPV